MNPSKDSLPLSQIQQYLETNPLPQGQYPNDRLKSEMLHNSFPELIKQGLQDILNREK